MSNELRKAKRVIPKISDIVANPEQAFKNDQLKAILNQHPPLSWIKKNKFANNSLYLPIDKVELMLDMIFQNWKVEVLKTETMFNAVAVTVRLHYQNPITGEWMFHDGVGAKELQTKSDTGVLKVDFSNVNNSAVEMALPIAKTLAIKDAAHHLGKLFGRDVNRDDTVNFVPKHIEAAESIDLETLKKGIKND
jgi:hypothetical protein